MLSWIALLSASCCLVSLLGQPGQEQDPAEKPPQVKEPAESKGAPAKEAAADEGSERGRPANVEELMRRFARVEGLEAEFRESKKLALLVVPLESRGRLYYLRPSHLLRRVVAPEKSSLRVTPGQVRLRSPDRSEVIDLRKNDQVRSLVTALLCVLRGDLKALRASFRVRYVPFDEDARRWTLVLEPASEALRKLVRKLEYEGAGSFVEEIRLVEPNGDRTVTRILEPNPKRKFDADEKARLFGIEKPAVRPGDAASGDGK